MLSKRSTAYKTLGLAAKTLPDNELLDLMVQEPTLLRRPLVVNPDGQSVVGFNVSDMQRLIGT